MIFGEESERSTPPEEAGELLSAFIDAGGNFIDTANVYADGRYARGGWGRWDGPRRHGYGW